MLPLPVRNTRLLLVSDLWNCLQLVAKGKPRETAFLAKDSRQTGETMSNMSHQLLITVIVLACVVIATVFLLLASVLRHFVRNRYKNVATSGDKEAQSRDQDESAAEEEGK